MFQRWVIGFTAVWLGIGAIAGAQDRATVQMRDGSKFEGRIEELTANGELFVRVSQHDQRRVPVSSVALIDKVGRRERPARHRDPRGDGVAALAAAVERLEPQGAAGRDSRRRRLGERRSAAHLRVPRGRPRADVRSGAGVAYLSRRLSVRRERRRRGSDASRTRQRVSTPASIRPARFASARPADGSRPACAFAAARSSRSTRRAKCSCRRTAATARVRPAPAAWRRARRCQP